MPLSHEKAAASDDLIELFFQRASAHPQHTAISENGRPISYGELAESVRAIAAAIGPRPGVVVVLANRSADTIARLLGVFAAGGTYCPVDPAFPVARQQSLVDASGCRFILPPSTELTVASTPAGAASLMEPPDPESPAYLLFTSGSTGAPKPVLTPRRAIAAAVRSLTQLLEVTEDDRVLQFASLNWDTCFEEILPTLTSGGTLVIHDDAYAGSFPRLMRQIAAESISVLDLPTAFWHEFVRYLVEDDVALPGCLRVVVIGGEATSPARLADWCSRVTDKIRLVNTYGCTETTLVTHAVDLHGPLAAGTARAWTPGTRVPIGRPLPHVLEHVSDDGELLIAGPAVALGYLDLPAETAERFEVLDLGAGPQRYFHTGDRVSRAPDGALVHQGRLDGQIKVRGIRVDPGEVEAQIAGHPDVAAVAVAAVAVGDHTTMTAYVVAGPRADGGNLGADILSYLRDRTPRHLIPNRITVVPELVHTASGKIDRSGSHQRYGSDHISRS